MTRLFRPAVLAALLLLPPQALLAQSADAPASESACVLLGKHFSQGATVRLTGERARCEMGENGPFWRRNLDDGENRSNFVFCVFEGRFYSLGSLVGNGRCSGNGNWDTE